jgi:hypothetical protein
MDPGSRIKKMEPNDAPMFLIYGAPGHGKTTLASEFPNPIFIQLEDGGSAGINPDTFGVISTYDEMLDCMRWIIDPKNDHGYETLVIDGLGDMDRLLTPYVCEKNKWADIEEGNSKYGKGYAAIKAEWVKLIQNLIHIRTRRNMSVVVLCHDIVEKYDDPVGASYNYHGLAINRKMEDFVCGRFDNILFLRQDATVKDGKVQGLNMMIHCNPRPSFTAKNRYGMPDKMLFIKGEGYKKISQYLNSARTSFATKDLSNEEAEDILNSKMDPKHNHLNSLMDDKQPIEGEE